MQKAWEFARGDAAFEAKWSSTKRGLPVAVGLDFNGAPNCKTRR